MMGRTTLPYLMICRRGGGGVGERGGSGGVPQLKLRGV